MSDLFVCGLLTGLAVGYFLGLLAGRWSKKPKVEVEQRSAAARAASKRETLGWP